MEWDGVVFLTLGTDILSAWREEAFGEEKEFIMAMLEYLKRRRISNTA